MHEANGHGGRLKAKGIAARRIMEEIGEKCTYAELNARMVNESNTGGSVTEPTYYAIRRELWPHLARARATNGSAVPAVLPDRPADPPHPPARDWLARLVKFGVAVEDVGGIGPARRMLDALEQLQANVGA